MICHVREATEPVAHGEELVSWPRIAVQGSTAPPSLRHVVVQVDVYLLLRTLGRYGIEHLQICESCFL
jgi:hypothetical protein